MRMCLLIFIYTTPAKHDFIRNNFAIINNSTFLLLSSHNYIFLYHPITKSEGIKGIKANKILY